MRGGVEVPEKAAKRLIAMANKKSLR
jgi:hypothetical protein